MRLRVSGRSEWRIKENLDLSVTDGLLITDVMPNNDELHTTRGLPTNHGLPATNHSSSHERLSGNNHSPSYGEVSDTNHPPSYEGLPGTDNSPDATLLSSGAQEGFSGNNKNECCSDFDVKLENLSECCEKVEPDNNLYERHIYVANNDSGIVGDADIDTVNDVDVGVINEESIGSSGQVTNDTTCEENNTDSRAHEFAEAAGDVSVDVDAHDESSATDQSSRLGIWYSFGMMRRHVDESDDESQVSNSSDNLVDDRRRLLNNSQFELLDQLDNDIFNNIADLNWKPYGDSKRFVGHCNSNTDIKEAVFWGNDVVMSGSDDGNIYVWSVRDGKLINILSGHNNIVNCVQVNPCYSTLATSGIDDYIGLWNPDEMESFEMGPTGETALERCRKLLREETFFPFDADILAPVINAMSRGDRNCTAQ